MQSNVGGSELEYVMSNRRGSTSGEKCMQEGYRGVHGPEDGLQIEARMRSLRKPTDYLEPFIGDTSSWTKKRYSACTKGLVRPAQEYGVVI